MDTCLVNIHAFGLSQIVNTLAKFHAYGTKFEPLLIHRQGSKLGFGPSPLIDSLNEGSQNSKRLGVQEAAKMVSWRLSLAYCFHAKAARNLLCYHDSLSSQLCEKFPRSLSFLSCLQLCVPLFTFQNNFVFPPFQQNGRNFPENFQR